MNFTREGRDAAFIKLSGCHKADISTPREYRGRGPSAASYRVAMTQMTMGGAGARQAERSSAGGSLKADSSAATRQQISPLASLGRNDRAPQQNSQYITISIAISTKYRYFCLKLPAHWEYENPRNTD